MNNDFQNTQSDMQLEEMRRQMQTLKNKLEKQTIVNDHYMRRSMKKRTDKITQHYRMIIALAAVMLPYSYWAFVKLSGFSVAFWIGTCVFMLVCAAATAYNRKRLTDINMMHKNLVEVSKKLARAKKFDADWLFVGIPLVVLWFGWFMYEVYTVNHSMMHEGLFWGGCVGAIVGAIAGYKMHIKTQRQYQDIIDQIEDITNE